MIFTPKYRRDVFTDDEVRRTYLESYAHTSYVLGVRMEACEFSPDQVNLFVSRCKNYSVPYLVQRFRAPRHIGSGRSRERVKGKLWGNSF